MAKLILDDGSTHEVTQYAPKASSKDPSKMNIHIQGKITLDGKRYQVGCNLTEIREKTEEEQAAAAAERTLKKAADTLGITVDQLKALKKEQAAQPKPMVLGRK